MVRHLYNYRKLIFFIFLLLLIVCRGAENGYAAEMEDYCLVPPYVKRDVSVNIMILFDNSDDMLANAYQGLYCDVPAKPPLDTTCFNGLTNQYYHEYYGHFPSYACYVYLGNDFSYTQPVDFSIFGYPNTGCPAGQFSGNILNWVSMTQFSLAKKVLTGEASTSINSAFDIEGQQSFFDLDGAGNNWIDFDNCRWTITTKNINQPGIVELTVSDLGGCNYPLGGPLDVIIDPTPGIEVRTGVLQEFTDPDNDLDFNFGSPRFGITNFSNTIQISETIPPNNFEPFINTVKTMNTRANNDLATAHKVIDDYFTSPANDGVDPFKGCASWEKHSPSEPGDCVQGNAVPCRKNFILMLTTGNDVSGTAFGATASCTQADPLVKNACYAFTEDLRNDISAKQNIETYVVHTFGSTTNDAVLKAAANDGGGKYYSAAKDDLEDVLREALQDIIKRAASGTAASVLASGEGSGANLIQAVFYPRKEFPNSGTGVDDQISWIGRLSNLWYYVDPRFGNSSIREETDGVDALDGGYKLHLVNDNIAVFAYDSSKEQTIAQLFDDTDGDGDSDGPATPSSKEFENLGSLWEAGTLLWQRDANGINGRTIKVFDPNDAVLTDGIDLIDFATGNVSDLESFLDLVTIDDDLDGFAEGDYDRDGDVDSADAGILIDYVRGVDHVNLRERTVRVDLNGDGDTADLGETEKVWKLGDVLNSTPKIASWIPPNTYHKVYSDGTYGPKGDVFLSDPVDPTRYITTNAYKGKGMVYAGGNDGMLHAFRLGTLNLKWPTKTTAEKAWLSDGGGAVSLGKEEWAYIPRSVLPYLKYMGENGYCHLYSVDLTPFVFDASIGGNPTDLKDVNSWRTILIGGMRYGGACRDASITCDNSNTVDLNGDALINDDDCVKTPTTGEGFSAYFALDITDETNPQLLWEFTHADLGFSTTGPAVIRISAKTGDTNADGRFDGDDGTDNSRNGYWFVAFASGPTGPIDKDDQQFFGFSDRNLKLFVLDLKRGLLQASYPRDTGIQKAFGGSLINATNDSDVDYQDDSFYVPYVRQDAVAGTWTEGGVLRVTTKEDVNPNNWAISTVVDGVGPVTSSAVRLQNNKNGNLWLYFGSGRYFYEMQQTVDDGNGQRQLFGIKEPCFDSDPVGYPNTIEPACTSSVTFINAGCPDPTSAPGAPPKCGDLHDVSDLTDANVQTLINDPSLITDGWYVNLDPTGVNLYAERVITDPVVTVSGLVFFTTFKPYIDQCEIGGKSSIWAMKYNTGGEGGSLLLGKAIVQVSTGEIKQVDLKSAFTERDNRRTGAMEGVPPTAQGLSLLITPPPVKRILHMQER